MHQVFSDKLRELQKNKNIFFLKEQVSTQKSLSEYRGAQNPNAYLICTVALSAFHFPQENIKEFKGKKEKKKRQVQAPLKLTLKHTFFV